MKKITANLTVKLLLYVNENADVSKVINELNYNFSDTTTEANIIDSEIIDFEIKDSR